MSNASARRPRTVSSPVTSEAAAPPPFDELEFYRVCGRLERRAFLIRHTLSTSDDSGDERDRSELDLGLIDVCTAIIADVHALNALVAAWAGVRPPA
jgi:hypothetical protein